MANTTKERSEQEQYMGAQTSRDFLKTVFKDYVPETRMNVSLLNNFTEMLYTRK